MRKIDPAPKPHELAAGRDIGDNIDADQFDRSLVMQGVPRMIENGATPRSKIAYTLNAVESGEPFAPSPGNVLLRGRRELRRATMLARLCPERRPKGILWLSVAARGDRFARFLCDGVFSPWRQRVSNRYLCV
ncbi:MAG: hypothetical protein ACTS1X_12770 [Parasphingopyxis sp.]|uniref:hypothetical protein n=1 Tax=Parasphingopyxis sp. TaxID=1920299 RepID=UPI003F9F353A